MHELPESFGLDRLQTPIGTALLVTDADGALRALDWEDYEPRMQAIAAPALWRGGAEDGAGAARRCGRR